MVGQFIDGFDCRAVQPQPARHHLAIAFNPRADRDLAIHAIDICENRKAGGFRTHARDVGQDRAA